MTDPLRANLARLARRQPNLARAVAEAAARPSAYVVEAARSGDATLVRRGPDGDRRLASAYDPRAEGARVAAAAPEGDEPVLVLGWGAGWHVEAVLARTRGRVVVAEADPSLLAASLAARNVPALEDPRLSIVGSADPIRVAAGMRAAFDETRHRSFGLVVSPAARAAPGTYGPLERLPAEVVAERLRDRLTRLVQEPLWISNVLANLPRLAGAASGRGLDLLGASLPAFVVGAGPSLGRNVGDLTAVGDGGLVVAVDTALRALEARGLAPHLVVAVDANEANAADVADLPASYLRRVVVAADPVLAPAFLERHAGPVVVSRTVNYVLDADGGVAAEADAVADLAEALLGPIGRWQSGGSVSTNAFDLAARMRCDPIVLVGVDLAYTGGRTHVADVGMEEAAIAAGGRFLSRESWYRRALAGRRLLDVPAWEGGTVPTDAVLDGYRRWLEDTVEFSYKGRVTVLDATEGGAAKRGIPPARLADVVRTRAVAGGDASRRLARLLDDPAHRLADRAEVARRLRDRVARWREAPETASEVRAFAPNAAPGEAGRALGRLGEAALRRLEGS